MISAVCHAHKNVKTALILHIASNVMLTILFRMVTALNNVILDITHQLSMFQLLAFPAPSHVLHVFLQIQQPLFAPSVYRLIYYSRVHVF